MKLGVFSDIHDNLQNLEKALNYFKETKIKTLIFCGDFCSPIPLTILGKYPGQIHSVFGNNDGDRFTMSKKVANASPNIILHGEYADIKIGGKRVGITHYPFYGKAIAKSNDFDLVCAGHTHIPEIIKYEKGIFLNPGDVMGLFDAPSIAVVDLQNMEIIKIEVSQL
jgi:putative phosphoesterase